MRNLFKWLDNHQVVLAVVLVVLAVLGAWGVVTLSDKIAARQTNKQDRHLEKSINASDKAATTSEANANTHAGDRQAAEARADAAWARKQKAALNSNRTLDRVRKARQRDEETSRRGPADSADLSDEQLCAELAKRSIPCR